MVKIIKDLVLIAVSLIAFGLILELFHRLRGMSLRTPSVVEPPEPLFSWRCDSCYRTGVTISQLSQCPLCTSSQICHGEL